MGVPQRLPGTRGSVFGRSALRVTVFLTNKGESLMTIRKGGSLARRGTVAVVVALLLPVMIGVTAVGLDGGLLFLQRRQAQSIADASALAGAYRIYSGSNFSTAQSAAIAIGTQNGVTISTSQVTQPQTGYISVTVTVTQPRCFSAIWGSGTMSANATAVACGMANAYSTAAILVLDPSATAITLSGYNSGYCQERQHHR